MGSGVTEFIADRRRLILETIEKEGRVLAPQLASRFSTSEDTIRRDLREMDRAGLLRRVHGGAIKSARFELPFRERVGTDAARKAVVAAAATHLVQANEVVMIDAGSTNLQIAKALPDGLAAAIVTTSPDIASAVSGLQRTEVILLGGTVRPGSGSVSGARALRQVDEFRPDLCFLGACSVDAQIGLCASNSDEAVLKQAMAHVSRRVGVALLRERLLARAAFRVLPFDALDHLVVEPDSPPDLLAAIRNIENGPELVLADGQRT